MKNISALALLLVIGVVNGVEYYNKKDEFTDIMTYVVKGESNEYGKYEYMGRAAIYYYCSQGSRNVVFSFPHYMGDEPVSLEIRLDKEDSVEYRNITGGADRKSILLSGRDAENLMIGLAKSNKITVRGYNYEGISESPFTFGLSGWASRIQKANEAGSCTTIEYIEQEKANAEKIKKEFSKRLPDLLNKYHNGIIHIKKSDWGAMTRTEKNLFEELGRVYIVDDIDTMAADLRVKNQSDKQNIVSINKDEIIERDLRLLLQKARDTNNHKIVKQLKNGEVYIYRSDWSAMDVEDRNRFMRIGKVYVVSSKNSKAVTLDGIIDIKEIDSYREREEKSSQPGKPIEVPDTNDDLGILDL